VTRRRAYRGFANPLRDLAGDATYLAEFLRTLTGPVVLVGHSYGGNVISMAAAGNDQVKALVYLNGWMCDEGESQQQLLERFEGSLVGPSIRPVPYTGPDGSVSRIRGCGVRCCRWLAWRRDVRPPRDPH
jgi:pimeloyl-ACP methyl ester carboxylesterase